MTEEHNVGGNFSLRLSLLPVAALLQLAQIGKTHLPVCRFSINASLEQLQQKNKKHKSRSFSKCPCAFGSGCHLIGPIFYFYFAFV